MITWSRVDKDGKEHLIKTFESLGQFEAYFKNTKDPEEEEKNHDDGCWNCYHYDGDRCMKEWSNLDECYYLPDRDDKEPTDYCDDHDKDESITWEECFEED